jgi:hypothetical protein
VGSGAKEEEAAPVSLNLVDQETSRYPICETDKGKIALTSAFRCGEKFKDKNRRTISFSLSFNLCSLYKIKDYSI